jgi:hypothetical protein
VKPALEPLKKAWWFVKPALEPLKEAWSAPKQA